MLVGGCGKRLTILFVVIDAMRASRRARSAISDPDRDRILRSPPLCTKTGLISATCWYLFSDVVSQDPSSLRNCVSFVWRPW